MFTEKVSITPLIEENLIQLNQDLYWDIFYKGSGYTVIAPKGFNFDGATVPQILGGLIQKIEPRTIKSATIHDRCYKEGREQVYRLRKRAKLQGLTKLNYRLFVEYHCFYEPLLVDKTPKRKAVLMYLGVLLFGWIYRYKLI